MGACRRPEPLRHSITQPAMSRRRVVVTGMGIVSPVGIGIAAAWESILAARSGIGPITRFDASSFPSRIGGLPMIEDTKQAYLDGGLRKISPFFVPGSIINMISGLASIHYGYQGPNLSTVSACSTANHSLGEAARIIEYGDADVMVAGGTESTVSPLGLGGFCAARALSTRNDDPATASRPWDKDRDGFVLGEGAGVLVLEEYEHAKARGAKIYAEVGGYGMSGDA